MIDLERFRKAQRWEYETALQELRAGRKQTHWIWYMFPQLTGLGHSSVSQYYGLQNLEEARAYWEDPELSAHLLELSRTLLRHHKPIYQILPAVDVLKLQSCMTLFWLASGEPVFHEVLEQFYDGQLDKTTCERCGEYGTEKLIGMESRKMATILEKLQILAAACAKALLAHKDRIPEQGRYPSLSVLLGYPGEENLSGLIGIDDFGENFNLRVVKVGIGRQNGYYMFHHLFTGTRQEVLDWMAEKSNCAVMAEHLYELKEAFMKREDEFP